MIIPSGLTSNDINDIWRTIEPIQNKAGTLIFITFNLSKKRRLRRREIASMLGVQKTRREGGLLSDKTLDKTLKNLVKLNFLEEEKNYDEYPPGKYFIMTSKGEDFLDILGSLINKLKI